MKELVEQLMKEVQLTEKQATQSIHIIKEFAKKKLPVFAKAIDKLFDKYGPKQEDDFLD
ncbi:MAG: hypothetical protein ACK5AB_02770 [Bacteroidota bacterium]|jgi:hypothetical protein